MARKRLNSTERKALILEAAKQVFSGHGYNGAKTQAIAAAAGVSEALVYRHFPSKEALYRAVLRQTIREQDANYAMMGLPEPSTKGLVQTLKLYFLMLLSEEHAEIRDRFRLLLSSLAGDGSYARLIYRRAGRKMHPAITAALEAAQASGDLTGELLAPANTSMFIEHVGTMAAAIIKLASTERLYEGDREEVVRQAVVFCCRGLGLTDAAIRRAY